MRPFAPGDAASSRSAQYAIALGDTALRARAVLHGKSYGMFDRIIHVAGWEQRLMYVRWARGRSVCAGSQSKARPCASRQCAGAVVLPATAAPIEVKLLSLLPHILCYLRSLGQPRALDALSSGYDLYECRLATSRTMCKLKLVVTANNG